MAEQRYVLGVAYQAGMDERIQKGVDGGAWTVTGQPPAITVTPSIWHNQPAGWHGWIRDGVLVDA